MDGPQPPGPLRTHAPSLGSASEGGSYHYPDDTPKSPGSPRDELSSPRAFVFATGPRAPIPPFVAGASVRCFPSSFLAHELEDVVIRLAEILALTRDEAFLLLHATKWDAVRAADAFSENSDVVRERIGMRGELPPAAPPATGTVFDAVLLEDVAAADCATGTCGHVFAVSTWRDHLTAALTTPLKVLDTRCPLWADGCGEVVRPSAWRQHLGPDLWPRYVREMVRSFTAATRRLAVCPGGGCDLIVEPRLDAFSSSAAVATIVKCSHGHRWCFSCLHAPHAPASCELTRAWDVRELDEGESMTWVLAHTKRCPQCSEAIEKNQGCSHVRRTSWGPRWGVWGWGQPVCVCSRSPHPSPPLQMTCLKCKHYFCWLCLMPLAGHTACNGRPKEASHDEGAAKRARAAIDLYAWTWGKVAQQRKYLVFAEGQLRDADTFTRTVAERFCQQWTTVASFLHHALETQLVGRSVAQWTYVHAAS